MAFRLAPVECWVSRAYISRAMKCAQPAVGGVKQRGQQPPLSFGRTWLAGSRARAKPTKLPCTSVRVEEGGGVCGREVERGGAGEADGAHARVVVTHSRGGAAASNVCRRRTCVCSCGKKPAARCSMAFCAAAVIPPPPLLRSRASCFGTIVSSGRPRLACAGWHGSVRSVVSASASAVIFVAGVGGSLSALQSMPLCIR